MSRTLFSLCLALSAALSAAPAGASKRWTEPEIEKAVEAMVSECAVAIYARVPRPKDGCPKQLEVLAKLKDRAVPVVTRKLLRSVDEKARGPAKLQQSPLVRMLGMIRTPASTLALISVLEYPGVQQDGLSVARLVHNQLLRRSGNHLEFTGQTEEERRQLAAAWRRWWSEQAPAVQAQWRPLPGWLRWQDAVHGWNESAAVVPTYI